MHYKTETYIHLVHLRKAVLVLRALRFPVSIMILKVLARGESLPVGAIEDIIRAQHCPRIKQSEVSNHLGILRRQRIVTYTKSGTMHFYRINQDRITQIVNALNTFFK